MASASWAAQKAINRKYPKKFKRAIENSHPIRTLGKVAAGAALGTAAGAAGLAIAATTGDLSNVAKMGGGAAAAGYAVGSGMAKGIKSPMQDKEVKAIYDDVYNKGEKGKFKQDAMADYVDRYIKDATNIQYFEQVFGKKEAKEMLKSGGEVEQYLYNNITDKTEMKAMHKLQKENIVNNANEAIAVSQLSQMIGKNTNNMTTKERNEWKTRIGDMAAESGVKNQVKFANNRLKEIDKLHDFKK
jgi:predicted CopG family antitoxin